ncbi:hypothetical protein Q428_01555 [Fervidicella metallireducens AeB]|uniref:Uncharacterized protein n=1 Tax=Fervidicella metallireducens AeB TaxID=1403537 RepID=A0A017RXV5_9CLOT|nr:hypothetical protein [Fervidicella metallireducens]EYE89578.1 hypothetical protein Q428_01555 [Fervidicella metallireducens AeB]
MSLKNKLEGRMRIVLSILIILSLLLTQFNQIVLAGSNNVGTPPIGGDNGGGGSGGVSSGSQYTWSSTQVGFRVTLVDK